MRAKYGKYLKSMKQKQTAERSVRQFELTKRSKLMSDMQLNAAL